METRDSPLGSFVDPFMMFPLELTINKMLYKSTIEACNFHLHNGRKAELESVVLVRDPSLAFSALRVQFHMPLLWMTGQYYM